MVPLVERLAAEGVAVSVDTWKPAVARAALAAGAAIVNDASGLRDPERRGRLRRGGRDARGHPLRRPPKQKLFPAYDDVAREVVAFLSERVELARARGVERLRARPGARPRQDPRRHRGRPARPAGRGRPRPPGLAGGLAQGLRRRADRAAARASGSRARLRPSAWGSTPGRRSCGFTTCAQPPTTWRSARPSGVTGRYRRSCGSTRACAGRYDASRAPKRQGVLNVGDPRPSRAGTKPARRPARDRLGAGHRGLPPPAPRRADRRPSQADRRRERRLGQRRRRGQAEPRARPEPRRPRAAHAAPGAGAARTSRTPPPRRAAPRRPRRTPARTTSPTRRPRRRAPRRRDRRAGCRRRRRRRGETRNGVLDVLPNGSGFMRPDPFSTRARTCTSRPRRSAAASCARATRSPGRFARRAAPSATRRSCASRRSTAPMPTRPPSARASRTSPRCSRPSACRRPTSWPPPRSAAARGWPSAARPAPASPRCCGTWPSRWPSSTTST